MKSYRLIFETDTDRTAVRVSATNIGAAIEHAKARHYDFKGLVRLTVELIAEGET